MPIPNVEAEYRKNKELKKEDVKALQEWVGKQPHLPEITEFEIILFLHSCYYRNEAAKITIDNFFTARTHAPEFFTNHDPNDKCNKELNTLLYSSLPNVTHEGNRVIYACLMDTNPDNYNFNVQIKCFDMSTSVSLWENGTDAGYHCVSDLKGVTFAHITKLNLTSLRKFFFYLQYLEYFLYSLCATLPNLTTKGHRVIYMCLMDTDANNYNFNLAVKVIDMGSSVALWEHGTDVGHHWITDLKGVSFGHIPRLSLTSLKKFFFFVQEATPVRIKGFHFINIVPFMDKIMALIKPFMKKELLDVLHLHTDDLSTIYKFVPKECLPRDYGGNAPSRAELYEYQKKMFCDPTNLKFYEEMEKKIVNENLRPGKPKNAGDIFGIDGTFKKLDID